MRLKKTFSQFNFNISLTARLSERSCIADAACFYYMAVKQWNNLQKSENKILYL